MTSAPSVRLVIVVDLTDPYLDTTPAVEDAVNRQVRGDLRGAHVRLILGDAAARWPSSAISIAGRLLGAASVDVEHSGEYASYTRTFADTLRRELQHLTADFNTFTTG